MSKTYFCELVSGFFLNLNQTTLVIVSGLSRSIIIEKTVERVCVCFCEPGNLSFG